MDTYADIVIIGGGTGGCAAALAAARSGATVLLTDEFDWIGGQLTSQAVPPDEHRWIESHGCTRSYRQFRNAVRNHYRTYYPLTDQARRDAHLDPGNGWVSALCHEARAAHSVIRSMLTPDETAGRLRIWTGARPVRAETDGDHVRSVEIEHAGQRVHVSGRHFLDATELGDLLALSGTELITGAESHAQTGEPGAKSQPEPSSSQPFTWCFAMEHRAGEDHRIDRPDRYSYWKEYVPKLQPPWPGRLFSWTATHPFNMQPITYIFEPHSEVLGNHQGMWTYRRIVDRSLYRPGMFPSDICLVNWPLNDYMDGDLNTATPQERQRHLAAAREMSLSLFYWLQNDAPRPDGKTGWPGLKLAGAPLGTADGLAQAPYIRESRRILAL